MRSIDALKSDVQSVLPQTVDEAIKLVERHIQRDLLIASNRTMFLFHPSLVPEGLRQPLMDEIRGNGYGVEYDGYIIIRVPE